MRTLIYLPDPLMLRGDAPTERTTTAQQTRVTVLRTPLNVTLCGFSFKISSYQYGGLLLLTCRLCLLIGLVSIATLLSGDSGTPSPSAVKPSCEPTLSPRTPSPTSCVKPELEKYFHGNIGAFVLYDLKSDQFIRYNPDRCAQRFLPASTFKILNSLIGLETGVIADENHVIKWDGTPYDIPTWNQDHTLQTAIRNSVVWYYQELARRVGEKKMRYDVEAAHYGNNDISGQIDTFWLEGALRISADEQVEFLRRLYLGELPFSVQSMDIVKKILVLEKGEARQLSGKTGSAQRVTPHVGWFVGYTEIKQNVYFFATNFESTDPNGFANGAAAQEITLNILQGLGIWP